MKKRILALVLLLSVLAVFSLGSGALPPDDLIKQEDEQTNDVKHDSGGESRYTYVHPELYDMPDTKLVLDTASLLTEVVNSNFMMRTITNYSSSFNAPKLEFDFYPYEGFAELITRDDLAIVLENYAKRVLDNDENITEINVLCFEELLKHETIKMLVANAKSGVNSKNNVNSFPYLDIMYDSMGEAAAAHPMRAAFDLSFYWF